MGAQNLARPRDAVEDELLGLFDIDLRPRVGGGGGRQDGTTHHKSQTKQLFQDFTTLKRAGNRRAS
jgi:hypothetical protein